MYIHRHTIPNNHHHTPDRYDRSLGTGKRFPPTVRNFFFSSSFHFNHGDRPNDWTSFRKTVSAGGTSVTSLPGCRDSADTAANTLKTRKFFRLPRRKNLPFNVLLFAPDTRTLLPTGHFAKNSVFSGSNLSCWDMPAISRSMAAHPIIIALSVQCGGGGTLQLRP